MANIHVDGTLTTGNEDGSDFDNAYRGLLGLQTALINFSTGDQLRIKNWSSFSSQILFRGNKGIIIKNADSLPMSDNS